MQVHFRNFAGQHYAEHKEKPSLVSLVDFITSGPVFAMVMDKVKV